MEYLSQAVRAKAEECLAAVDDGKSSSMSVPPNGHVPKSSSVQNECCFDIVGTAHCLKNFFKMQTCD